MKRISALALGILLAAPIASGSALTQADADREAVRQALLDYVEGIYNADPARVERSAHPDMIKRGYYRRNAADTEFVFAPMTRAELITLAGNWNKAKNRNTSLKEVIVHEVLNQTASGKVIAAWGIDYMHLAKHEGRWKYVNILWQEPPPRASAGNLSTAGN